MHGLYYIERRSLNGNSSLSWDLAHHMYARTMCGKAAVVTDRPQELMAATRKQWVRMIRRVQNERSRTLDANRLIELSGQIAFMQGIEFACKLTDDPLTSDITFATAEEFVQIPPMCPTVYVTCKIEKEKLYLLTSWLPRHGVSVLYR